MTTFKRMRERMKQLPDWLWEQTFTKIQNLQADSEGALRYAHVETDPLDANLMCSKISTADEDGVDRSKVSWENELHMPMWDIDIPLYVRETSPGHWHLAINAPLLRKDYEELTRLLARLGIVQRGWSESALGSELGGCLRPPWVSKEQLAEAQLPAPF